MGATTTRFLLCGAVILLAGCGSASASVANGAIPTAAASPAARGLGGGTAGQLVKVVGTDLTLSTTSGDVTVAYTSATTITSTSTGSSGDIVVGSCVVIVGLKDAAGAVTATTVRLSAAVNGACNVGLRAGGGAPGSGGLPTGSPPPARSGGPTLNPNAAFAAGMVSAVTGTTITVTSSTGTVSSVTVPTTLSITESSPASGADLTIDSCVRAVGPKDAQGVVQATALTIQPTNATGSCTFARGGFGGGRFGGVPPAPAT